MKNKIITILLCATVIVSTVGCSFNISIGDGNNEKPNTVNEISENNIDKTGEDENTEDSNTDETTTEDNNNEQTNETVSSGKWINLNKMQFKVNNYTYTLGKTTLKEMINDGCPFDEDDIENANNNLKANYQSEGFKIKLGEYWSAQVHVGNYTKSSKTIKDCPISEVYFPVYSDKEQSILSFAFPTAMSESELKANAGTPTDTKNYSSDGYENNTYKYTRESTKYYGDSGYTFEFTNGELRYVTLKWLP